MCPCCGVMASLYTIRTHAYRHKARVSSVVPGGQPDELESPGTPDGDQDVLSDQQVSDESSGDGDPSSDEQDSPDDEPGEPETVVELIQKFAVRTRADIAHNGSQAHTTRQLKTLHQTLFKLLPPGVKQMIPRDARTLHVLAGKTFDPKYFFRDFCPKDHYMFSNEDAQDATCPHCKSSRCLPNGVARRRAIYFDLADYVQRILSLPGMLELQLNWQNRQSRAGIYRDAVDGSLLRGTEGRIFTGVADEDRKYCIGVNMCTDATQVVSSNTNPRSLTPVVCEALTLPGYIRKKFTAMYLAAVLPKGAKATIFLEPIAQMFASVAPGTEGIRVGEHTFWVVKCWRVDDMAGISAGIRSKRYPATNGACIQCKQQGIRSDAHETSYYMGAFSELDVGHELRRSLADSYRKEPTLAQRASTLPKVGPMTERSAKASARRMESGTLTRTQQTLEPFHGYNPWTLLLLYFNIILQSIPDPFHTFANTMRDLFALMQSDSDHSKHMRFNKKRKAYEIEIGRSANTGRGGKQAFTVSRKVRARVDEYVQSGRMRLPSSWPPVPYIFEHIDRLSCSALVSLAGPLGLYFLQFCDVDTAIRDTFTELINCMSELQAKVCSNSSLSRLQERLVLVLTKCEIHLPLYWCTIVRHTLLHMTAFIRRCGPYNSFTMSKFEAFHTIFKKLVRAKNGEMQSIANHYTMLLNGDRAELEAGAASDVTPYPSTVSAAKRV